MTATRTFHDVSPRTWERMKEVGRKHHATVFDDSEDGAKGIATTHSPLGTLVLAYEFDPGVHTITYRIERKPMLMGEFLIWNGIEATLGQCRRG